MCYFFLLYDVEKLKLCHLKICVYGSVITN